MNSGAFVMLIIRLAWSQLCGGRTYRITTKHWIKWAVWKLLQGHVITQPSFQFTDNFSTTMKCREIQGLAFVLRQQMWVSADGRSENRTKIQILGFHSGATNQQTVERQYLPISG